MIAPPPGTTPLGGPRSGETLFRASAFGNSLWMGVSDDRVEHNEAAFRDANDRILSSAREYSVTEAIPFLCECADPACTSVIRLSADEFSRIRSELRRSFSAPGHTQRFHGFEVVEHHPKYDVVVKSRVAEVAEAVDPPPRA